MKELFHQYFIPSNSDFRTIWENGFFSFDANVLLNIYRYSESTRLALLLFIKNQATRLHIPYQFALEFTRNRPLVIMDQADKCNALIKKLEEIETTLSSNTAHPHVSNKEIKKLRSLRNSIKQKHNDMVGLLYNDSYADQIHDALLGRIGAEPSEDNLKTMHEEAKKRFAEQIPPGFADSKNKSAPECYGDYIAWKQLILFASTEKKDVVLVTDDSKNDWWQNKSGKTIGPRPELLSEFKRVSSQRIWLYPSDRFLTYANQYLGAQIDPSVITEVRARIKERNDESDIKMAKPVTPAADEISEEKRSPRPSEAYPEEYKRKDV